MRVKDGKASHSIDIGAYLDEGKKSVSLLREDLLEGDMIKIII